MALFLLKRLVALSLVLSPAIMAAENITVCPDSSRKPVGSCATPWKGAKPAKGVKSYESCMNFYGPQMTLARIQKGCRSGEPSTDPCPSEAVTLSCKMAMSRDTPVILYYYDAKGAAQKLQPKECESPMWIRCL